MIPGYRFVLRVGSGPIADIHQYEEVALHRSVVVKVLRDKLDQAVARRLQHVTAAAASIRDHGLLERVYHIGVVPDPAGDGDRVFLVKDYHTGSARRLISASSSVLVIGVTVAAGASVSSASSFLLASTMPPHVAVW